VSGYEKISVESLVVCFINCDLQLLRNSLAESTSNFLPLNVVYNGNSFHLFSDLSSQNYCSDQMVVLDARTRAEVVSDSYLLA